MFLIMLSLAISLIIVVFALQNSTMVPIVFFNWSSEIPLVVLLFASVFAGAAIIFFLALWKDLKRKFTTVSSKATEYKGIVNSKKDALSAKKDALSTRLERKIKPEKSLENVESCPASIADDPISTAQSADDSAEENKVT